MREVPRPEMHLLSCLVHRQAVLSTQRSCIDHASLLLCGAWEVQVSVPDPLLKELFLLLYKEAAFAPAESHWCQQSTSCHLL